MTDRIEQLRVLARLDLPDELRLLAGTLNDAEWDRLSALLGAWQEPGPIPRWRVRACLDWLEPEQ
jgi:hypothetical protein